MNPSIRELPSFSNSKDSNIHPHQGFITRDKRNMECGHQSGVVWLTGLSGSGKSTIANQVERILFQQGYSVSI